MKTLVIVKRIVKQIINDKRSLALILVVPVFLFTLIYFLMGDTNYKPVIAVNGIQTKLVSEIKKEDVTVKSYELGKGKQAVKDKKVDALLYMKGSEMKLLFESNDTVKVGTVTKALQNAMKRMNSAAGSGTLDIDYIYGKNDENLFNSLGYILLGIISFFLIFIIAGISFVRERTLQTMERLMMTPVKRWQVVLGYTLGFGIFAILQSIILLCYTKWILKMPIAGNMVSAGVIMILLSMSAVCIGAFFSIYANNEFQMMQFIPVIIIPQIFFSGLISLDVIPYHLGMLAKVMPVYYACDALNAIIIKGTKLTDLYMQVIALLTFIVLFFIFNIIALKKYRKI